MTSDAEDMAELETLLAGHRATLQRVIDLAAEPRTDRLTQRMLDVRAKRARFYLRRIEVALKRPVLHPTHGHLGLWGENGLAPTIRDLASSAEFQASYVPFEFKTLGDGREQVAA
jgi:hypothetical protein